MTPSLDGDGKACQLDGQVQERYGVPQDTTCPTRLSTSGNSQLLPLLHFATLLSDRPSPPSTLIARILVISAALNLVTLRKHDYNVWTQ
jgi:hypothetical protein